MDFPHDADAEKPSLPRKVFGRSLSAVLTIRKDSRALSGVCLLFLVFIGGCSGADHAARVAPAGQNQVVVSGSATVDGVAFDAQWIGAEVLKNGLVTPCQRTLSPVAQGRYSVRVLGASASSGCGSQGSYVVLWTASQGQILHSTNRSAWPRTGTSVAFSPVFSTATPGGASPVTAEFTGQVWGPSTRLPAGTVVDAFIGATRCGTASVRSTSDYFGYILAVVGPDSVPGCTRGAPLAFRVNGHQATSRVVVNTPPGKQRPLDITAR
jgi:hypothetical protein